MAPDRSSRTRMFMVCLLTAIAVTSTAARAQVPPTFTYATMSDGVKIAIAVTFPPSYDPGDAAKTWPALFTMHGYPWSVDPLPPDPAYVSVVASIRGTGCSGGVFQLFSDRSSLDGYEIIENWIVKQPWSNGDVGIFGHSYPGITGFLVAATAPPHVRAVTVSGLIDDFYRGITYPGGISNRGFPVNWSTAFYTYPSERASLASRGEGEIARGDATCAANMATHATQYPFLPRAIAERWDDDFWQSTSLASHAQGIHAPIHIGQQYQDEQTGPSGNILWERIQAGVPKRLVLSNGEHATRSQAGDARRWLDCWVVLRGTGCPGDIVDPSKRVQVYFETRGQPGIPPVLNQPLVAGDFPLPDTAWTRLYLRDGGVLSAEAPGAADAPSSFRTMTVGRSTTLAGSTLPGALTYSYTFPQATALAGPAVANLWASISGGDADFYVEILDRTPEGRWMHVQRGLLRASHRALDEGGSLRNASGVIVRPRHPHTLADLQPVVSGEPVSLAIEIPTFGHVFREGHTMLVRISSPPETDPVGGTYVYASELPPADVAIRQDAAHPSNVLLPALPVLPPLDRGVPACDELQGLACASPDDPAPPSVGPLPSPSPENPDPDGGLLVAGAAVLVEADGTTPSLMIAVEPAAGTQVATGAFFFKDHVAQATNTTDTTATGQWILRTEKQGSTISIDWLCARNADPGHRCRITITDGGGATPDVVRVEIDDDFVSTGSTIAGQFAVA